MNYKNILNFGILQTYFWWTNWHWRFFSPCFCHSAYWQYHVKWIRSTSYAYGRNFKQDLYSFQGYILLLSKFLFKKKIR